MNVLSRKIPSWSPSLTVMSESIQTSPNGFPTALSRRCWLKGTKNSIGCGVKNGATRLKQHSLTPDFLS